MYKGNGKTHSGFSIPYSLFAWKQNELFRNIHEYQFEHLRNVYKRQWLEAYRVNSDEYIYKYNITKAAQMAKWEAEMEEQEAARRDSLEMAEGRQALRDKHRDILKEYHEREFFRWYERASERLQYMSKMTFISAEDLDKHVERELNKYVVGKNQSYPLNFVGQMPMVETADLEIAAVPRHLASMHKALYPGSTAEYYEAPVTETSSPGDKKDSKDDPGEISAQVYDIDQSIMTAVADDIALETAAGTEDKETPLSSLTEAERGVRKQQNVLRGRVGFPKAKLKRSLGQDDAAQRAEGDAAQGQAKGRKVRVNPDDEMMRPEDLAAAAKHLRPRKSSPADGNQKSSTQKPRKGELLTSVPKMDRDAIESRNERGIEEGLRYMAEIESAGKGKFVDPTTSLKRADGAPASQNSTPKRKGKPGKQ